MKEGECSTPKVRSEGELSRFRSLLLRWFEHYGRTLPWRGINDPYKIWLSEVILQQTQVAQGWDYYELFVERFPTVQELAEAEEDEVLLMWQGLGYYSRALNMHHAAKQIVREYGGKFPKEQKEVASLKGVGPYTTAAIMSIAYGEPLAVVDGNVYRVLSRVEACEQPIDTTQGQKHYRALADAYLDKQAPGHYNQAIMDLGAMICTPRSPRCSECPISQLCKSAGREDLINLLPIKAKKTAVRDHFMDFFLMIVGEEFVVEERDRKGIWKGLYQFPLVEHSKRHMTQAEIDKYLGSEWRLEESKTLPPHRLTHRLLSIRVHICYGASPKGALLHPINQHHTLAFPKPLRHFLDSFF